MSQIAHGLKALNNTLEHLSELALGGTAVGTGLNTPKGYSKMVAKNIAELTNMPFITAENKFEALAAHDAIVETHGALKQLAVSINKIANDIRMLASGPRSGIGELIMGLGILKLKEKGYIDVVLLNKRDKGITLSPKGKELKPRIIKILNTISDKMTKGISEEKATITNHVLQAMKGNLE